MEAERALAISALEHHEYCARQCALIHGDQVWEDNAATVRGSFGHRRVDQAPSREERGRKVVRAIPLWSERFNLTGRADVVEIHDDAIVPVEYKIGVRHGRTADIQLCAQALCLEEMFETNVSHGFVWYSAPRRRHRVEFDRQLRRATVDAIDTVRATLRRDVLPEAVDDERCASCQLVDHCLPSLSSRDGARRVAAYVRREVLSCGS